MRITVPPTAIALVLAAGAATAAHAQTVIAPAPLVTVPAAMETVQTTETVRSIRPARIVPRQVVTTRTVTRRIVPGPVVASTAPRRLYDVVGPAPLTSSDDDYASPRLYDYASPRLYDVAAPGPVVAPAIGPAPVFGGYAEPFVYRYVYEPDRILVIDPTTGIAVQAIPR
jgi:hypothetical protein